MKAKIMGLLLAAFACVALPVRAGEDAAAAKAGEKPADVQLPAPAESLKVDLMEALRDRKATREYAPANGLDAQTMSNLLWAAFGVNRPELPAKRTAPFAMGVNTVRIYAVTRTGAYRYEPEGHKLVGVAGGDLRAVMGKAPFFAQASAVFLFTYDKSLKRANTPDDRSLDFAWNGVGAINQNLALAAAAQKLGTVVVAGVNAPEATKALGCSDAETALIAMPVGPLKQ